MTLSTGDEEELLSSENLEESHFSIDMENEEESQEEQDGLWNIDFVKQWNKNTKWQD